MNRLWFAAVWISLQFIYLMGWTLMETSRLRPNEGVSILVRTAPVDPRDLLRGQYMRLNYAFNRTGGNVPFEPGEHVYVLMRPDHSSDEVFYVPISYSKRRPSHGPDEVVLKGRAASRHRATYGIEKYFVPNGVETPAARSLTVRLRIGSDDRARIEQVYRNGSPWP